MQICTILRATIHFSFVKGKLIQMELLERDLPKQKLCTWRAKVVAAHIWALLGIQNIFQILRNFSVQKFPSSPRWSSFMMLGSHISNKGFFVTVSSPNCTMSCWVPSCCCCCVRAVEKLIWQPHATWIPTYSIWCSVVFFMKLAIQTYDYLLNILR